MTLLKRLKNARLGWKQLLIIFVTLIVFCREKLARSQAALFSSIITGYKANTMGIMSHGEDIIWTPCGPEILPPNHSYFEINPLLSEKFYRIRAVDP